VKKKKKADTYRLLTGAADVPEAMNVALRQLADRLGDSLLDLDVESSVKDIITVRFRVDAPNVHFWGGKLNEWLDPVIKKITELFDTNCGGTAIKLHWNAQNNEKSWFELSGFLKEKIEK